MKKFILTAIVAVIAVSANAQMWIGGEAGYNTYKTTIDGTKISSGSAVTILPEVGYSLNENWDVAVAVGYAHKENVNIPLLEIAGTTNSFVLNPYVRYTYYRISLYYAMQTHSLFQ